MAHFLPITLEEVKRLGWDAVDVVLVTGDAYIDHPSFGTAVIGRSLEAAGFRVAIIPQPNWRDDLRDFRKFGRPRLFFGVTSGAMDSMVNHYTAARRLRHDDAYTPGGQAGFRPDRAAYVYCRLLKQIYPDVPVVLAGIEASMRRLAHYDYWDDRLFPSILADVPADLLNYGMGERTTVKMARMLAEGRTVADLCGLPLMCWPLLAFDHAPSVGHIVVVCAPDRVDTVHDEVLSRVTLLTPVTLAASGETRQQSVAHGLAAMPRGYDFVAVHDAARPRRRARTPRNAALHGAPARGQRAHAPRL